MRQISLSRFESMLYQEVKKVEFFEFRGKSSETLSRMAKDISRVLRETEDPKETCKKIADLSNLVAEAFRRIGEIENRLNLSHLV